MDHSGVYTPNLQYSLEIYSASWLQKISRFLTTLTEIEQINALESATTGPLLRYRYDQTKSLLMTRDYFDFFVEHLSSTSNQIHEDPQLIPYLSSLLIQKIHFLKKNIHFSSAGPQTTAPLADSTVVIIPYSCKSASQGNDLYRIKELRLLYFQATFWSIFRYFHHVMVYVSSPEDYITLSNLQLPLDTLIQAPQDYETTWA
jgi:hypothetical protein